MKRIRIEIVKTVQSYRNQIISFLEQKTKIGEKKAKKFRQNQRANKIKINHISKLSLDINRIMYRLPYCTT